MTMHSMFLNYVMDRRNEMAKQRRVAKAAGAPAKKAAAPSGGTVSISVGLKLSANYNSEDFNVGATIPLGGDSVSDKLAEAKACVMAFFTTEVDPVFDHLDGIIQKRKRGR